MKSQRCKQINKYHNKIIILHCVATYPTKLKDIKLHKIKELKNLKQTLLVFQVYKRDYIITYFFSIWNSSHRETF